MSTTTAWALVLMACSGATPEPAPEPAPPPPDPHPVERPEGREVHPVELLEAHQVAWTDDGSLITWTQLGECHRVPRGGALTAVECPSEPPDRPSLRVMAWSPPRKEMPAPTGDLVAVSENAGLSVERDGKRLWRQVLEATRVIWHPDGTRLAVALDKAHIAIFDAETGEILRRLEVPPTAYATDMAWSEHGLAIAGFGLQVVSPEGEARYRRDGLHLRPERMVASKDLVALTSVGRLELRKRDGELVTAVDTLDNVVQMRLIGSRLSVLDEIGRHAWIGAGGVEGPQQSYELVNPDALHLDGDHVRVLTQRRWHRIDASTGALVDVIPDVATGVFVHEKSTGHRFEFSGPGYAGRIPLEGCGPWGLACPMAELPSGVRSVLTPDGQDWISAPPEQPLARGPDGKRVVAEGTTIRVLPDGPEYTAAFEPKVVAMGPDGVLAWASFDHLHVERPDGSCQIEIIGALWLALDETRVAWAGYSDMGVAELSDCSVKVRRKNRRVDTVLTTEGEPLVVEGLDPAPTTDPAGRVVLRSDGHLALRDDPEALGPSVRPLLDDLVFDPTGRYVLLRTGKFVGDLWSTDPFQKLETIDLEHGRYAVGPDGSVLQWTERKLLLRRPGKPEVRTEWPHVVDAAAWTADGQLVLAHKGGQEWIDPARLSDAGPP